jgi:hypothetical protein
MGPNLRTGELSRFWVKGSRVAEGICRVCAIFSTTTVRLERRSLELAI